MEVNLNQIDSGKNNNKIMVTKDHVVKKANVFFCSPSFLQIQLVVEANRALNQWAQSFVLSKYFIFYEKNSIHTAGYNVKSNSPDCSSFDPFSLLHLNLR